MSVFSSLTNRIFLASALLLVVSIGIAVYRVTDSVSRRAEVELRTGLSEAASLVNEYSRAQFDDFVSRGKLVADLPVLKNSVATDDPPTVQPNADRYQREVDADLFVVLGRTGRVLARAGRVQPDERGIADLVSACRNSPDDATFWPYSGGVLHAAALELEPGPAPIGTLLIGFSLDQDTARRLKALTNSEIAFGVNLLAHFVLRRELELRRRLDVARIVVLTATSTSSNQTARPTIAGAVRSAACAPTAARQPVDRRRAGAALPEAFGLRRAPRVSWRPSWEGTRARSASESSGP